MEFNAKCNYVRAMKTIYYFAGLFALAVVASGCGHPQTSANQENFTAQLTGGEQVPAVATTATGSATFWLNAEGTELHYQVTVNGLNYATMAHLHLAEAGKNGPPVAWLYPSAPPPKEIEGASNGILCEGKITASDLAGPLAGKTIADLVAAIHANDIYVNVHTRDHADGEIRGQVK